MTYPSKKNLSLIPILNKKIPRMEFKENIIEKVSSNRRHVKDIF
jgi:hypothetical protein